MVGNAMFPFFKMCEFEPRNRTDVSKVYFTLKEEVYCEMCLLIPEEDILLL